jgi:hypothetical protein
MPEALNEARARKDAARTVVTATFAERRVAVAATLTEVAIMTGATRHHGRRPAATAFVRRGA